MDAAGPITGRQDYTPWGQHRGTATIPRTQIDFTGQRLDDTGLLFYNARYYDPKIGRFISADTIVPGAGALAVWPSDAVARSAFAIRGRGDGPANPQALNRYTYVSNNPVSRTDPTGHLECSVLAPVRPAFMACEAGKIILFLGAAAIAAGGIVLADQWLSKSTPTDRLQGHLTDRDLEGARKHLKGEQVLDENGRPWQHLKEVMEAQDGLYDRIQALKNKLSYMGLSEEERAKHTEELEKASRLLDKSEQYVPWDTPLPPEYGGRRAAGPYKGQTGAKPGGGGSHKQ
jgi:RHS repeat-associated protein